MTNFNVTKKSTTPRWTAIRDDCVIVNMKPQLNDCCSREMTKYCPRRKAIAVDELSNPYWASMNKGIVNGYQRFVGNFYLLNTNLQPLNRQIHLVYKYSKLRMPSIIMHENRK